MVSIITQNTTLTFDKKAFNRNHVKGENKGKGIKIIIIRRSLCLYREYQQNSDHGTILQSPKDISY